MIFHLSSLWTIAIDIIVWFCIHLGVSVLISMKEQGTFNPESWLYRDRDWEKSGRIYEVIFKIKGWKRFLPDGAAVSRNGFRKKKLQNWECMVGWDNYDSLCVYREYTLRYCTTV